MAHPIQKPTWKPREDEPAFSRDGVTYRWRMLSPLATRALHIKYLDVNATVGELLCSLLSIVVFVGGGWATRTSPGDSGNLACLPIALAFVTASRNSVFTVLLGLPFERALWWHKWFAAWSVLLSVWHGLVCGLDDDEAITGVAATSFYVLLLGAFVPLLRRHAFELFYRLHWVVFILAALATLVHGGGAIAVGGVFWLADVAIRYAWLAPIALPRSAALTRLKADVVRVSIPRKCPHTGKPVRYKAGQYFFLCVPGLSRMEWHPFSASSSPSGGGPESDDKITLHVRVLGDWTKRLHDVAGGDHEDVARVGDVEGGGTRGVHRGKTVTVPILLDGPYGEPSVDVGSDKYKMFVLISGGIGITPLQSICNQLLEETERGRPVELIRFVWVVRDKYLVEAMLPYDENAGAGASGGRLPDSFQPDTLRRLSIVPRLNAPHPSGAHSQDSGGIPCAGGVAASSSGSGPRQTSITSDDVPHLHTEFYLTRARADEAGRESANIRPGAQRALRFGRPDVRQKLRQMKELALERNLSVVAVLTCGPASLVRDVKNACVECSGGGVTFDVHHELFEF